MISGLDDEVKKEPITWDPGSSFGRHLYSTVTLVTTLFLESCYIVCLRSALTYPDTPKGRGSCITEMFLLFLGSLGQSPIVARVPSGEANTCFTHEI